MTLKYVTSVAPKLDDGLYDAEIEAVEETISKFDDKDQFKFAFKIIDEDEDANGVRISAWVNKMTDSDGNIVITPRSKLFALLSAIYSKEAIEDGLDVDVTTDELKGRKLRVNVLNSPGQNGGEERPKITAYSPVKKRKAAQ